MPKNEDADSQISNRSSGASSTAGGLVIDLSLMREVSVNPSARTITAQGGCIWADVDEAAGVHGLATVGGTVNHTGVGGLTLGGGYGWLSGLHGLTIDNLLAVEMVLADGSIIVASSTSYTDLFWAIRGAGHAYGVATSFTFNAHEQPNPVFAGTLAFLPHRLSKIVAFANHAIAASEGEIGMAVVFAAPPPRFAPCIMVALIYNGPEAKALETFRPLLELKPLLNTTAMVHYSTVNGMLNPAATHGGRKSAKGAAFATPLRPSFAQSIFDDYARFLNEMPDASGSIVIFEFIADGKICEVPNDAMAFANRGNYQNAMFGPKWSEETNDEFCRSWARQMAGRFDAEMKDRKKGGLKLEVEGVGQYANYDALNEKGETLLGKNFERLKELKRRFDPGNLFNKSSLQI